MLRKFVLCTGGLLLVSLIACSEGDKLTGGTIDPNTVAENSSSSEDDSLDILVYGEVGRRRREIGTVIFLAQQREIIRLDKLITVSRRRRQGILHKVAVSVVIIKRAAALASHFTRRTQIHLRIRHDLAIIFARRTRNEGRRTFAKRTRRTLQKSP